MMTLAVHIAPRETDYLSSISRIITIIDSIRITQPRNCARYRILDTHTSNSSCLPACLFSLALCLFPSPIWRAKSRDDRSISSRVPRQFFAPSFSYFLTRRIHLLKADFFSDIRGTDICSLHITILTLPTVFLYMYISKRFHLGQISFCSPYISIDVSLSPSK